MKVQIKTRRETKEKLLRNQNRMKNAHKQSIMTSHDYDDNWCKMASLTESLLVLGTVSIVVLVSSGVK